MAFDPNATLSNLAAINILLSNINDLDAENPGSMAHLVAAVDNSTKLMGTLLDALSMTDESVLSLLNDVNSLTAGVANKLETVENIRVTMTNFESTLSEAQNDYANHLQIYTDADANLKSIDLTALQEFISA